MSPLRDIESFRQSIVKIMERILNSKLLLC